ncbi:MAG: hypothetical protein A2W26_00865 [Acidobacteria bacterium RBG_16_64_8]|nr:MAG: hypothetical protein A2W26_00865 [Acidobacteria bacterium RBG_16_64_8]
MIRWVGDDARGESGAALALVLVFMVVLLILFAAMFAVTGNEIVISGLHRDGVRAMEAAQAGIAEGIRRIEHGRPGTAPGASFTASTSPAATVTIVPRDPGAASGYLEIQSTATVGRATRRLSTLIFAVPNPFNLPNILYGQNCAQQGNAASVESGDVYCRTFVQYVQLPGDPNTLTYAGWRISKANPGALGPCQTHAACVSLGQPNWYPATRRSVYENNPFTGQPDPVGGVLEAMRTSPGCVPNAGTLPAGAIAADGTNIGGQPEFGFDADDPDGAGPVPEQAVEPDPFVPAGPAGSSPLPPKAFPCGLPFRWIAETFDSEDQDTPPDTTRYFKTVVWEHYFRYLYYRFDPPTEKWVPRSGASCTQGQIDRPCLAGTDKEPDLAAYRQFGAIAPFVPFDQLEQNYNLRLVGGGTINNGDPIDLGLCNQGADGDIATCDGTGSYQRITVFDCEPSGSCTYTLNGGGGGFHGNGLLLVDGDLNVNGTVNWWGTIVVNGSLTLGSGNVRVYGGVVANSTAYLTGNIEVHAGGDVGNPITGGATVAPRSWWER